MSYWREAFVVIGACVLVYAGSAFSGSLSGSWQDARGSIDGEVSYARDARLQMTAGAGLLAIGLVARRRR